MELKVHAESTDTASKHMVTDFCEASTHDTVESYLQKLRQCKTKLEGMPYVYVTEKDKRLIGAVSLHKLVTSEPRTPLSQLMERTLITVRPHTDRERVALLAIHNQLKAIPVVDAEHRLIGVVPEQSILQILHEENVEDFLRAAGIHHAGGSFINVLKARTSKILRARLPWLLVGFVGGIIAIFVVKFFEATLEARLSLAFFIPLMLYMGAATGVQSGTLFLRSELLGEVDFKKYVFREGSVGPLIGLILGIATSIFAFFITNDLRLALIIGLAMLVTVVVSVLVGILIPFILLKFKKDPAAGSGPFATIIQDILSLLIYFGVTSLLLL